MLECLDSTNLIVVAQPFADRPKMLIYVSGVLLRQNSVRVIAEV